ncbi:MAG: hypothetical protein QF752_17305 [Planctomycetota bacterium]|jgi:hypothetical protein|nr:hypothetical protein [Planctomycetota bacterium]
MRGRLYHQELMILLHHESQRLGRRVYLNLVESLGDEYPNQTRTSSGFEFRSFWGGSCSVGTEQTQVIDLFQEDGEVALVLDRVGNVLQKITHYVSLGRLTGWDCQISSLLAQEDLNREVQAVLPSTEHFIRQTFLQPVDTAALGGNMRGTGIRWLYQIDHDYYDLTIQPYQHDSQFLHLSLYISYAYPPEGAEEVLKGAGKAIEYLEGRVVDFVIDSSRSIPQSGN